MRPPITALGCTTRMVRGATWSWTPSTEDTRDILDPPSSCGLRRLSDVGLIIANQLGLPETGKVTTPDRAGAIVRIVTLKNLRATMMGDVEEAAAALDAAAKALRGVEHSKVYSVGPDDLCRSTDAVSVPPYPSVQQLNEDLLGLAKICSELRELYPVVGDADAT